MDRSLCLLLGLRAKGGTRRWLHGLRTLKGALLASVGLLVLVPLVALVLFIPRIGIEQQALLIRRFGPMGLLGYCVLNVLLSSGERAIYYTPAEVNLLFSGPYRARQLLVYKVAAGLGAALFATALLTLLLQHHAAQPVAVFLGMFLALEMLFLLSIAMNLLASTVGAAAFNRQRKLLLAAILISLVAALLPAGRAVLKATPAELFRLWEESPALRVVVAPFRPFVMAFTAEHIWPDLAWSAALALAIDLALLGLVLGLNFEFLEVSAVASARKYEMIRRAGGAMGTAARTVRIRVPMLPWWGGIGPNSWRQLTTALRSWGQIAAAVLLFVLPIAVSFLFSLRDPSTREKLVTPLFALLASLAVFAPTMVGYDFRPDLVRMEHLKTLPIRPSRLVVGQVATPVLVLCVGVWFGLAVMAVRLDLPRSLVMASAVLAVPLNVLFVGAENLFFLWFPTRFVGGHTADLQTLGRQLLLMTGRLVAAGTAAGAAAGLGTVVYFLCGERWLPAIVAAWLVLAVACGGLIVLVGQAFQQYDVARDKLE